MNGNGAKNNDGNGRTSILLAATGLIYSITQRIAENNRRDNQAAETENRIATATRAIAFIGFLTFIVGLITSGVLVKQWQTFEKTDKTLRAGERAFVYIDNIDTSKSNDGSGDRRAFLFNAINNGETQTKDLQFFLICEYGRDWYPRPFLRRSLGQSKSMAWEVAVGPLMWFIHCGQIIGLLK